ncbi:hypothetical protein [Candidatus Nitrosocaldus islandicus]|uniref:hypothetical protein n=1 Tax=Candidatus Nitrosocaldus islandicus TaxID=2045011 RepID=UPI000CD1128B|nr:hypothetical protein [Candidatus Nitrosocaldus islandicus]
MIHIDHKIKSIGIKAFIKPRRNARVDRGPPERRNTVKMINKYGEEIWSKIVGYGKRLMIRQHSQHSKDYMGSIVWLKI